jgi:hypothetical protein
VAHDLARKQNKLTESGAHTIGDEDGRSPSCRTAQVRTERYRDPIMNQMTRAKPGKGLGSIKGKNPRFAWLRLIVIWSFPIIRLMKLRMGHPFSLTAHHSLYKLFKTPNIFTVPSFSLSAIYGRRLVFITQLAIPSYKTPACSV